MATTTSSGGFWDTLGQAVGGALQGAATFGNSLLQLEILKRFQASGIALPTTTDTGTGTGTGTGSGTPTTTGTDTSNKGLPKWVMPVGLGVIALVVLVTVLSFFKKGK